MIKVWWQWNLVNLEGNKWRRKFVIHEQVITGIEKLNSELSKLTSTNLQK